MGLAIDGSTPAEFSTATALSITSGSFTPPNNALLVVLYGANGGSAQDISITSITNTGTGFTWTRRARKNKNAASNGGAGEPGGAEIWTAPVTVSQSMTVTVNGVDTGTGRDKWAKLVVLTGADANALTNVAAASSGSGLASVNVTGCAIGSLVFAVSSDWAQMGNCTPGTAQTLIDEYDSAGQISIHGWRTTNTLAAAGTQTMNLTAPSGEDYNLCAIEIRATADAPVIQISGFPPGRIAPNGIWTPTTFAPSVPTLDASVAPIAIQATTSVPAPALSAGATVSPNAVQAVTSVPAPALSAGATVAPIAIQGATSVPAPALSAGATVAPNSIQAVTSVPAPSLSAGATVSPVTINLTTSIPLPAVSAGGNVNITPAAVQTTTSVPAPTLSAGATVSPGAVQAITSVPAPVTSAGASLTAVAVLAVTTLPTPGRSAGSTVTPAAVLASATLPAPVISANLDAHVSPAAILASTAVRVVTVVVEAPSQPLPGTQIPGTGGWLQLLQILREEGAITRAVVEDPFEIHLHEADYRSSGPPLTAPAPSRPLACPNDGEPLSLGPNGVLYCTFDGWQYGFTTEWTDE